MSRPIWRRIRPNWRASFVLRIEKANLTLAVDCPPLPEPIYIDREMWEKIVLNLLSNAFKHTFEGSIQVVLSWCKQTTPSWRHGFGNRYFGGGAAAPVRRFHRVKGAKSRTHEGTGIGLALVQELVSLHGGPWALRAGRERARPSQ